MKTGKALQVQFPLAAAEQWSRLMVVVAHPAKSTELFLFPANRTSTSWEPFPGVFLGLAASNTITPSITHVSVTSDQTLQRIRKPP